MREWIGNVVGCVHYKLGVITAKKGGNEIRLARLTDLPLASVVDLHGDCCHFAQKRLVVRKLASDEQKCAGIKVFILIIIHCLDLGPAKKKE